MKRLALATLLLTLSSCCAEMSMLRSTPLTVTSQGYKARVRIVCSVFGEADEVTLGAWDKEPKYHAAFAPDADFRKLWSVQDLQVTFSTKPGPGECFAQAETFVKSELPSGWSILQAEAIPGHCWRADGWRPCIAGAEPFESQAYPLHKGAVKHSMWVQPIDYADNLEKKLNLVFYVVVHPE